MLEHNQFPVMEMQSNKAEAIHEKYKPSRVFSIKSRMNWRSWMNKKELIKKRILPPAIIALNTVHLRLYTQEYSGKKIKKG